MREAIILAGGQAKRLKPFTDIPKPLLKLNDRYLLDMQIEWLMSKGFEHIIVAIDKEAYDKWHTKSQYLGRVESSLEYDRLGTSGALKKAMEFVDAKEVYVMNVDDMLPDFNPNELYAMLNRTGIVVLHQPKIAFGVARVRNNTILRFQEKPYLKFWVSCGHYLFKREVRELLPEKGNFEPLVLPYLAKTNRLQGYKYKGRWFTINSLKDIEEYLENEKIYK
jgi:NDP-sugar pyrophosphorylase family protein